MELNKLDELSRLASHSYKIMKQLGTKKRKMRRRLAVDRENRQAVEGRAMRRKLKKLRRLIPGGVELREADSLFVHTAEYIVLLRFQVTLLQALTCQLGNKDQP